MKLFKLVFYLACVEKCNLKVTLFQVPKSEKPLTLYE